jgi:pyruvate/2-oxoglutarate dehydrogenase complex dihydrolipoamide dehydrogenase (E3) component
MTYDAIVIGTGQAGPFLVQRLTTAGMKVAIVERKFFGGTCVNTGCIPTKTMVASAYAAHVARRGADYGFTAGDVGVDMKRVKARKDSISGASRSGVEASLRKLERCTVYQGHARFESARELSVGQERLTAERIFINVGGRASVPAMPGIDTVPYLTNSTMMDVDFLPRHLVIVGGSYIGLEFGQMFRRFGSEVTIIEMAARLIQKEDEDVSAAIREILEQEGINIRVNATCIRLFTRGSDVVAGVDCAQGAPDVSGSHLLLAAGIWALGDCNGKGAFTHTSFNDGEIVAANLLENDRRRLSDRIQTYGLFIDPPLGRAGLTEAEIRKTGKRALVGTRPMTKVGRAVEKGETKGFIKVIVDADTDQILGAAILGTGGDEVIHLILDAMYARAPYTVIRRAMHIHPTVSEFVPTVLGELRPLGVQGSERQM